MRYGIRKWEDSSHLKVMEPYRMDIVAIGIIAFALSLVLAITTYEARKVRGVRDVSGEKKLMQSLTADGDQIR